MIQDSRAALSSKYTIVQELPRGFLGPTVLIQEKETDKLYICKICKKIFIGDEQLIQNFKQKIQDMHSLSLPFLISYCETIETADELFLIRPYLKIPSLESIISTPGFSSLLFTRKIWKVIVSHYESLHNSGQCILPIKPTNIFIDPTGSVFIADLYQLVSDLSWSFQTANPSQLAFLAPEFYTHEYPPSESSDVWSLGVILYYMSTCTLPWSTKNICAMFRHISLPQPMINYFPPEFASLILKIFVNPPSKRPHISELSDIQNNRRVRSDSGPLSSETPETILSPEMSPRIRHNSWILSPGLPLTSNKPGKTASCNIRRRFLIREREFLPPTPPKRSADH